MKKSNRFASLKNDKTNPFKKQESSRKSRFSSYNSKRNSRFKDNNDKKDQDLTSDIKRNSRFNTLTNDSEKNTFRRNNYRRNNQRKGYRRNYNNRYYNKNAKIEDSVFKPSCLKNAGIDALLITKTEKQKKEKKKSKTKVHSYDNDELSQNEKEINKQLILQYQAKQEKEDSEITEITDCWADDEYSSNSNEKVSSMEHNDSLEISEEESEEEIDEFSIENYQQQFI